MKVDKTHLDHIHHWSLTLLIRPLPPLEEQIQNIVMDAFTIVNKMANAGAQQLDDKSNDEPLEDNGCTTQEEKNYDDPCVLEEAMEKLFHGSKYLIMVATILIMILCTIHDMRNKFVD